MFIGDLKTIRIAFLSTIYHTSFNLMCNNWVEKELNIKTNWELHGTGPSIIEKFLEGKLEVGYIGLPPTIIGINKGASIKCVAGGHVEGTIMIALNSFESYNETDQNLARVFKQFKNKTIGVARVGSIHDVLLRDMIKKVEMENLIKIKNYEITDFILIDMQKNIVDAAVGTPALATLLIQSLNTKIIIPPSIWWPYNPSYGIVVSDFLIDNYPNVVEKIIKLHKDACRELRETPRKVATVVEKEREFMNKDFILKTYSISPKYCAALPSEYVNSTMKFIKVLRKLGYIEKKFSKTEIFDFRFIKKIHPEEHHYNKGINL